MRSTRTSNGRRPRGRLSKRPPPELADAEAFARYSREYPGQQPKEHAEGVADAIVRRHCAGYAGEASGRSVLEALRVGPEKAGPGGSAVRWLIETISIPECTKLVVRCGVRYEEIARYVRAAPTRRPSLVRYLNQFSIQ